MLTHAFVDPFNQIELLAQIDETNGFYVFYSLQIEQ